MTRRGVLGALAWLGLWAAPQKQEAVRPVERHGNILVGARHADFSGGTLVTGAVVDGDGLFEFPRRISAWVPLSALPQIDKELREVYSLPGWGTRPIGTPSWSRPTTPIRPAPANISRLFTLSQDEAIARHRRIEALGASVLATVIYDNEIDLARWRAGEKAAMILGAMESRMRIWIDRRVDTL